MIVSINVKNFILKNLSGLSVILAHGVHVAEWRSFFGATESLVMYIDTLIMYIDIFLVVVDWTSRVGVHSQPVNSRCDYGNVVNTFLSGMENSCEKPRF